MDQKKEVTEKVLEIIRPYWGKLTTQEMERAVYRAISELVDEKSKTI